MQRKCLMIPFTQIFRIVRLFAVFGVLLSLPVFAQEHNMDMATDAVVFNISMTDYSFVVDGLDANQPLELQAGQVYQMHFRNDSSLNMAHEVLVGRNPNTLEGGFKHDFAEPLLSDVEVMLTSQMDGKDFMIGAAGLNEFELAVGQEITLEFTLPDDKVGDWEIGCFEFLSMDNSEDNPGPTHYDVGMHLPITVRAAMQM